MLPFEDYEEEVPGLVTAPPPAHAEEIQQEETYVLLSESEITSMTVKDLRNELNKRKQAVSVKQKGEIIQWLLSVAHLPPSPVNDIPATAVEENNWP
jgi:hypothetical protein